MAQLNINSNLYLGSNELRQLVAFLSDKRIASMLIKTHGVSLKNATSLQVVAGSNNKVTILKGSALDANLDVIEVENDLINYLDIPNNNSEYFVTIKHTLSSVERGTVSIQSNGQIIGVGTEFTKVLRGMPINAVKIRFPESTINKDDYEILSVDGDTIAFLNSVSFTPENNMKYQVVGCFASGISIPNSSKLIYSYDSYLIELKTIFSVTQTDVLNLAKVRNNGGVISVTDMRNTNVLSLI